MQRLEEGGFAHQRASSFEQQVLLAGVNFEGGGELLLSDSRGLMLARVDLPISNIHSFVDVGWWGRDQAWVLLQNSREELQLWSVMVGESTEGPQLGSELLATLSSDNGLLRAASNARVINDPGKAPGVLLYLPIPPLLQEGETGLLIPEARLAAGSNYHSYQIVSFAVPGPQGASFPCGVEQRPARHPEGKDSLKSSTPRVSLAVLSCLLRITSKSFMAASRSVDPIFIGLPVALIPAQGRTSNSSGAAKMVAYRNWHTSSFQGSRYKTLI